MALLNSYSLQDFLRLANRDKVPDHSWLSKTRSRLPHEVHEKVFSWVLALVAERGLVKGERIGVDGSTMEANAALRTIVRRDSGETYREMLTRMAKESGVETPAIDDLVRLDRKRKGKKLSNEDWTSPTDPDAKIARMKDGSSHLAFKPEHAVDRGRVLDGLSDPDREGSLRARVDQPVRNRVARADREPGDCKVDCAGARGLIPPRLTTHPIRRSLASKSIDRLHSSIGYKPRVEFETELRRENCNNNGNRPPHTPAKQATTPAARPITPSSM